MKRILIASVNVSELSKLTEFLSSEYEVESTDSAEACRRYFQKKRYEIIFIDIDMLTDFDSRGDIRSALGWFWELYPTMEIVVMAPQNRLRHRGRNAPRPNHHAGEGRNRIPRGRKPPDVGTGNGDNASAPGCTQPERMARAAA